MREPTQGRIEWPVDDGKAGLLIESLPTAIAFFDLDMRYLAVSRRWIEDYHLEGSDILAKSHYEIFPELPEHWKDAHRRALGG